MDRVAVEDGSKRLYATFFGSFQLYRATTRLPINRTSSCLELCRYLVGKAGRPIPREELLDLLWSDAESPRAAHRLHVAVSSLRRIIDEPGATESAIRYDGESYSIVVGAIDTDCDRFEDAYARGMRCHTRGDRAGAAVCFGGAIALYNGDYLDDHAYAEWTHLPREHFRERRLTALSFLLDDALARKHLIAALEFAEAILAVDDLREHAHRQMMRILYQMGERGRAIRQFELCAALLHRELGVLPSLPTQSLCEAIRIDAVLPSEPPLVQ